jgi:hypothetical protein
VTDSPLPTGSSGSTGSSGFDPELAAFLFGVFFAGASFFFSSSLNWSKLKMVAVTSRWPEFSQ